MFAPTAAAAVASRQYERREAQMICALTVRRVKPGAFDQFRDAFMSGVEREGPPPGLLRFNMVRNVDDPDEVICFGLFDGDAGQMRSGDRAAYDEQLARIAPFVEAVGTDGLFEVVEQVSFEQAATR
jgi:quinol monooxygenase YgiN